MSSTARPGRSTFLMISSSTQFRMSSFDSLAAAALVRVCEVDGCGWGRKPRVGRGSACTSVLPTVKK